MDAFAATCEAIASTASRLEKVRIAAEWLASLDDRSFGVGAVFLSGTAFPRVDQRRLSIGGALLVRASVQLTGWDEETVRACARVTGDLGEAMGLLAPGHVRPEPFGVLAAREAFEGLSLARSPAHKLELFVATARRLTPRAVKYLAKIATGTLRIGLLEKQVEEAIALATGRSKEAVRAANVRSGDLEAVALAARADRLEEVQVNLFHPIDFMLAAPLTSADDLEDPSQWWAERKLDGIRAQAHVEEGRVALFSRGLGDVTASFPDVVERLRTLPGPAVLDGELLATEGERALPFVVLQRRLSRKTPSRELLEAVPVAFVAWDLLHDRSGLLFEAPLEARRARLEALLPAGSEGVRLSPLFAPEGHEDVERLFREAREAGDEGLILKRRGSLYEPGRRGQAWVKLKRALGTLDVVITSAEQGHGRRSTTLSDYTFAVRSGEGFVNVGKAYSGLTDEEVRRLSRLLQQLTIERYGRVRVVRPELVLEVAFDTVQKSARHRSGYALRFPRIVRWRSDKQPHEADTLERVEELYRAALNTGRIAPATAPTTPPPLRTQRVDDLPLFGKVGKESED